eukprot:TRINITY_DN1137_c0_g1_i1.p2 TRINITY_DN1137_c0_g1~~TRINITY_DN1137_c0_g1_i1.p2  ORF type:complete len:99 (-),score=11.85 TRINITY_DN1137_c0_g1_i1:692-988(-)
MTTAPSSLFPLVHEFLVQSGLNETASKFKTEAGNNMTKRSEKRKLLEIYDLYRANTNNTSTSGLSKRQKSNNDSQGHLKRKTSPGTDTNSSQEHKRKR